MRFLFLIFAVYLAARLDAQTDGLVDPSFNPGTGANDTVQAIAVQTDGRVLIAGNFRTVNGGLARLMPDGSVDATFAPSFSLTADGGIFALTVQPDGKILAGGFFSDAGGAGRNSLVRLNTNGTVDPSFDAHFAAASTAVFAIALGADGTLYAGGTFLQVGAATRNCIVRLLTDGSVDPGFVPRTNLFNVSSSLIVAALLPEADGGVVAAGLFTSGSVGADPQFNNLIRLTATGAVDASFGVQAAVGGAYAFSSLARQPDGAVLVTGDFSPGSERKTAVLRLRADWTRDTTFTPQFTTTGQLNSVINSVVIEPGGGIVVGGDFDTVNGVARPRLARLRPDGTLDPRFLPSGGIDGDVAVVVLDAQQNILVGGDFTTIAGTGRPRIARLLNPPLPPLILTQPNSVAASSGDNVYFTVQAEISPGQSFQWFRDGVPLNGETSSELYLVNVLLGGSYSVAISNAAGTITSAAVPLSVQARSPGVLGKR